ncbi:MAG: DUF1223 domain-containing protein [Sulfitobacter sp.]
MKHAILALVAGLVILAAPVVAQDNPIVVELYTSQGCSSCPPADEILHELADRDDVIALALHVDYWDYIGWKDPFGDPDHAIRQREYAAAGNRRTIYTPEMVVQGTTDIVGARPMQLSKAIADHARVPSKIAIDLVRNGDTLTVAAQALEELPRNMVIQVLRYTPRQTTKIKRGENRGRTLEYANVVDGLREIGSWDGRAPLAISETIEGDQPVVVIVQQQNAGPILAAARLR